MRNEIEKKAISKTFYAILAQRDANTDYAYEVQSMIVCEFEEALENLDFHKCSVITTDLAKF